MIIKRSGKNQPIKRRVVMVFGVFDLFHKGHFSFLAQANKHGNVVAVVARDKTVLYIKKKKPRHNERMRLVRVMRVPGVSRAVLGDTIQGAYSVIKKIKPQIICIGYDQHSLYNDLRTRIKSRTLPKMKIIRLKAHYPKKFKTSIFARSLRKKRVQSK